VREVIPMKVTTAVPPRSRGGRRRAWLAPLLAAALLAVGATGAVAGDRKKSGGKIDPAVIYHNYCSVCHGDAGDGRSRARNSLIPAPANFTDPKLQGRLTREYMGAIVKHGKAGTAMVGYTAQLNEAEIAAVVDYVRTVFVDHAGDASLARGRTLYGHLCVTCHGVDGTGATPASSAAGAKKPRDLTTAAARTELTRERLIVAVAVGKKGTPMNGFAGQLSPADMEAVVDYVRKSLMVAGGRSISGTSAHGGRERDGAEGTAAK
jgi:cbb3-type cytochrome c oxidase subunit III